MVSPVPHSHQVGFQTVFEHMPVGIGYVSLEGKWLLGNPKLCELLHYSWQELQQMSYLDLTFAEDLAQDRSCLQRLLVKEITNASFEKRYRCQDGSTLWTHTSLSFVQDSGKGPVYFVVMIEEIETCKDREQREAAMLVHEIQARKQAERSNEQLHILQAITDHALANLSLEDLFRSVLSRIRGIMQADNIAVLLLTPDRTSLTIRAVDGIEEAIASDVRIPVGKGFAGTIAARCQPLIAGKDLAVEVLTPVLHEQLSTLLGVPLLVNNRVIGVVHIGMKLPRTFTQEDITLLERVADRLALTIERSMLTEQAQRAEQEVAMQLHHVQQMNQTLQHFVSIVGHEFRTALTGILGFSELLKDPDTHPKDVEDYANDIATDAHRLLRLVIDLLDLDRMQQGKMALSLQFQSIDLAEFLREQIAHAAVTAPDHHLSLLPELALPRIEGDLDKLKQVMTNLLSNAIKYSPEGGEIQVRAIQELRQIHLLIQDQGIGIPPEALTQIFEPYHRIQTQATHYIGGIGLGLPITKYLLELHGGSVWAESVLGQGSTFHFTLPVTQTSSFPRQEGKEKGESRRSTGVLRDVDQIFLSLQRCVDALSDLIRWKNRACDKRSFLRQL